MGGRAIAYQIADNRWHCTAQLRQAGPRPETRALRISAAQGARTPTRVPTYTFGVRALPDGLKSSRARRRLGSAPLLGEQRLPKVSTGGTHGGSGFRSLRPERSPGEPRRRLTQCQSGRRVAVRQPPCSTGNARGSGTSADPYHTLGTRGIEGGRSRGTGCVSA